jgi:hypothetical protein
MTKCSLFEKNPTPTTSPYRVQSPVSLSIFREFVKELQGNPIKITETKLKGLQRFCDEFSAKLSKFCECSNCSERRQFGNAFAGVQSLYLKESIEFIVNGTLIELEIAESLICPAV